MKASILINNYNYAKYLGQAIESCLNQDYPDVEIVVVDDGSTDNSVEVAQAFGDKIKLVAKAIAGQASAFDAGVANSTGDILFFLDSDDLFFPHKVSSVVKGCARLWESGQPVMVYHRMQKVDPEGNVRPTPLLKRIFGVVRTAVFAPFGQMRKLSEPPTVLRQIERYGFSLRPWPRPTSTIAINRAMANKVFPLGADGYKVFGDEIMIRCAALYGESFEYLPTLSQYRLHRRSYSHTGNAGQNDSINDGIIRIINEHLVRMGRPPSATRAAIYYDSALVDNGHTRQFLKIAKTKAPKDLEASLYIYRLAAQKWTRRVILQLLKREEAV